MPGSTTKGVPFALGADTADTIDTTMQSLAEWVDARPGVSALTTVQRDALAAVDKWDGRLIFNLTTGRPERYNLGVTTWFNVGLSLVGGDTIAASAPAVIPLVVKGAAAQSAALQEWQDSSGAVKAHVSSAGDLFTRGALYVGHGAAVPMYFGGALNILPIIVSGAAIVARGLAGQTAPLQEFQNSAGAVLGKFGANGQLSGRYAAFGGTAADGSTVTTALGPGNGFGFALMPIAKENVGLVVRGLALQVGSLTQWQNDVGGVVASVESTGTLATAANLSVTGFAGIGGGNDGSTQLFVPSSSSGRAGLIVQGAAAQTADLLIVRNSAAVQLITVSAVGSIETTANYSSNGVIQAGWKLTEGFLGSTLGVRPRSTGEVGLVVRGLVGQAAAFIQIQDQTGQSYFTMDANARLSILLPGVRPQAMIEFGVPDSGGAGFRMMRVAN